MQDEVNGQFAMSIRQCKMSNWMTIKSAWLSLVYLTPFYLHCSHLVSNAS